MNHFRWQLLLAIGIGTTLCSACAAQAQLVINEIDYDQVGTDDAEFVELYNAGSEQLLLDGYALDLVNGVTGSKYNSVDLSGFSLAAGEYFVVCGSTANVPACDLVGGAATNLIQNGAPDGILLLENGAVVDAVSYEGVIAGVTEGGSAPTDNPGSSSAHIIQCISRCPNGVDSDDNAADFTVAAPTPGEANGCGEPGCDADGDCGAGEVCVAGSCVVQDGTMGLCGDPATFIHDVQGAGGESPLVGQTVVIEGVVVGDFQDAPINGLFVQEEDADADDDLGTSEGVFVFGVDAAVQPGDVVRIRGQVSELSELTELSQVSGVALCQQSAVASPSTVNFPVASVSGLEALEGMLVEFPQTLTVTENFNLGRFGSLSLSYPGRLFQPTQLAEPGAAALAVRDLNERSRIELDDLSTGQNPNPIPYKDVNNTRRVGDEVDGLTGILSGRFGTYRVQPTAPVAFSNSNPRPAGPPNVGGEVKVASFNVLNFFTTIDQGGAVCGPNNLGCRGADSQSEYDRQLSKLLNALVALDADILALNELENNASGSLEALVEGLNGRVGAGTYDFVQTGTIGTDAIKVGLLYKPGKVGPAGAPAILDSSVNPLFIDTKSRPVLAQTFDVVAPGRSGGRFSVAVVHLKSKGSACDDVGDPDLGDLAGNCNATREKAVQALVKWLASDPTSSSDEDFLVLGDFNSYAKEDPIDAMRGAGYQELTDTFVGSDQASSYVFAGESGYLDYAFASPGLSSQVTAVAEWHHNGDEPSVLDYNLEFKTDDPFKLDDPFRASDHDSLVVGLSPRPGRRLGQGR